MYRKVTVMNFFRILLITSAILTGILGAGAEERDSVEAEGISRRKAVSFLGADLRADYPFSSYLDDVLGESLDMSDARYSRFASSLHLRYGFAFTSDDPAGRLYPGVWQGAGASVNLFQYPSSTGVPVSIYLLQGAPIVDFSPRCSLFYEWNFGVSAGWHPCDGIIGRSNLIVGSRVNAYINLNLGLRWRLSRVWSLVAALDLTHFSNGNTSFPNPGVNLGGVRVGVERSFGPMPEGTPFRNPSDNFMPPHRVSFDLTAYGAWRKRVYRGGEKPVLLNGHYAIVGLGFAPMLELKRWLRAGVSADFQFDDSSDLRRQYISGSTPDDIRFSKGSIFRKIGVGISARGELVMPFVSLNVGIGYNFIGPYEARASYQLANLKLYVTRSLFLNIGYQLQDFQRQNNLMLGLGYTFRSSRAACSSLSGR